MKDKNIMGNYKQKMNRQNRQNRHIPCNMEGCVNRTPNGTCGSCRDAIFKYKECKSIGCVNRTPNGTCGSCRDAKKAELKAKLEAELKALEEELKAVKERKAAKKNSDFVRSLLNEKPKKSILVENSAYH